MPRFRTPICWIWKFLSFLVKGVLNGACDGVSLRFSASLALHTLLQPPTNQLVYIGRGHPKPLPTEYSSFMGFQWVGLLASEATTGSCMGPPSNFYLNLQYIVHTAPCVRALSAPSIFCLDKHNYCTQ